MNIGPLLTIGAVGLASKLLLNTICAGATVNGLHHLIEALEEGRRTDRGVITVANHISVVDDPLIWGALPAGRCLFDPRNMRWTLGAQDIMFTNPIYRWFFRNGQVIETVRGGGVHQPAVDLAVEKLNSGAWIHIFPEGKVNQASCVLGGQLLRFKWGVGRMVMSTAKTPTIIPMHIAGLHKVMPEPRRFKYIPRPGHHISITFGDPTALTTGVSRLVHEWRQSRPRVGTADSQPVREAVARLGGELDTARLSGDVRKKAMEDVEGIDWTDEEQARANIVALLQRGVADLAVAQRP